MIGAHIPTILAGINIPVGDHIKVAGLDLDTIWGTLIASAAVLGLGFYVRARVSSTRPNKVQIVWEVLINWVSDQVETGLGPRYRHVIPLAVTIFMMVLFCNWVEILPGIWHNTDYLPSPSADVNLTYALAVLVFVLTNAASIRARGLGGYIKAFFTRPRWLAPIRVLEELMKPITLALRLFGNIFSGGIMIALLIALASPLYWAPASILFSVAWKAFDMAIGVIQAFIFALLTILYYQFAVSEEAH